jgi:hypothetical protein
LDINGKTADQLKYEINTKYRAEQQRLLNDELNLNPMAVEVGQNPGVYAKENTGPKFFEDLDDDFDDDF